MKNGYKILWSKNAMLELTRTIEYLKKNFTNNEIRKLGLNIEHTLELISKNLEIFPKTKFKHIYKTVVLKHNTIYYRKKNKNIEILSFFSNRQNPSKIKI